MKCGETFNGFLLGSTEIIDFVLTVLFGSEVICQGLSVHGFFERCFVLSVTVQSDNLVLQSR